MTPDYILAGKYRLVSLLGRGGMGAVWRAERLEWGSAVAVKLLESANETRPDVLTRFLQEARLAANLRSSHVVQVLDDGRDEATGTPFIVMELLEGETLAQRLARVRKLTPAQTSRIVTHVARALALAHELGMVHRDLKPDNIFLVRNDDEETAKVLDFGIAKWNVESFLADASTTTGTAIGTPSYMSPEQIKDSKRVDHRSDLWSLALIATECLTGRRAFEADNLLSLALLICNEEPPSPSSLGSVPSGVDAWFRRATARDLGQRFRSARELAEEFRRVCDLSSSGNERSAPDAAAPPAGVYEPTEVLDRAVLEPRSTEGLTRTQGAVAAFRKGHGRARALALGFGLLLLAGLGTAIRSEFTTGSRESNPRDQSHSLALRVPPRAAAASQLPASPSSVAAAASLSTARSSSSPASASVPRDAVAPGAAAPAPAVTAALPPQSAAGSLATERVAPVPSDVPASGAAPPVVAAAAAALAAPAVSVRPVESPIARADSATPSEAAKTLASPASSQLSELPPPSSASGSAAPAADAPASGGASGSAEPAPSEPAPVAAATATAPAEPQPALVSEIEIGKPFDREAARLALEAVALQARSCRPPGGPHGRGRVQVRFEPSGKIGAAWMMTPLFDNTVTGSCVLMLFRRATIPAFSGDSELVLKSFDVP